MSATTSTRHTLKPSRTAKRDICKTMTATKNLRAISLSLVQKLRSAPGGIPSTDIANQLAKEAVKQVAGLDTHIPDSDLVAIEKNIRRRLYDSLKVLVSIGAIRRSFSDKMLHWQGIAHLLPPSSSPPTASSNPSMLSRTPPRSPHLRALSTMLAAVRKRLDQKAVILQQLLHHKSALDTICRRNTHNCHTTNTTTTTTNCRIYMPFVLLRTAHHTHITLQTTPDAHNMRFTFSAHFELINDGAILDRLFCVQNPTAAQTPPPSYPKPDPSARRRSPSPPRYTQPYPRPNPQPNPHQSSSMLPPHPPHPIRSPPSEGATEPTPVTDPTSPHRVKLTSASPFPKFADRHNVHANRTPPTARKRRRRPAHNSYPSPSFPAHPSALHACNPHPRYQTPPSSQPCKLQSAPSLHTHPHPVFDFTRPPHPATGPLSLSASPQLLPCHPHPPPASPPVSDRALALATSPPWLSFSTPEPCHASHRKSHLFLHSHLHHHGDISPHPTKFSSSRLAFHSPPFSDFNAKQFDPAPIGNPVLTSPTISPLITPAGWNNLPSRSTLSLETNMDNAARRLFM